jgi:hypothetical protein
MGSKFFSYQEPVSDFAFQATFCHGKINFQHSNSKSPEKNREDTINALEREIVLDFQRTMNRITFDMIVEKDAETFAFVSVPKKLKVTVPEKGCISEVPFYDFDKQFYNFSFVSLLTRKESIDALNKSRVECNRVSAMSMFQIPNKYMKIEEFEQTQTQQIAQVNFEKNCFKEPGVCVC